MKKNNNYLLIRLEERNGEYEYIHRSVHKLGDKKNSTVSKTINNYVKEFYGGKTFYEDGGYYFYGGEIFVRVNSWEFISEEHYNVLAYFL